MSNSCVGIYPGSMQQEERRGVGGGGGGGEYATPPNQRVYLIYGLKRASQK